jgi:AcrR family transcriptional regulator
MSTQRFVPLDPAARLSERSDAARNRRKVLDAAERLFRERGIDSVSMDDVAELAGVGKGTLYRRFGDRSGLVVAVLDAHERTFQDAILRGAPPLGPGAPAAERLIAFLDAMCRHLECNVDLLSAVGPGRYRTRVYGAYHLHVAVLIADARPEVDAAVVADLLLGGLAPELYRHLRRDRDVTVERVAAGITDLARSLLNGGG